MAALSGSVPKQAMPFDDKLFQIIGADETLTIAQYEMSILPAFPPNSIIHDNACGLGPVTQSILATSPPDSIKIHATDAVPPMVQIYNGISAGKKWPSKANLMDAQKLKFPNSTFTHSFLSFGLPIIDDPVAAAKEMYRTLQPGGTAVTAFWLSIPQGESAQDTRRAVWGPDARIAIEPKMKHNDREYIRNRLVEGGFKFEDIKLYEKSAFLPVKDLDEFATAIWSAIGQPAGGWTEEDEEKWDTAVAKYKEILAKKEGFHVDEGGKITLEAVAHVAIVKKPN
ncbi:S-adenosyl-L-methionine-dependent methyltransferase [Hypoxylon trugodes]|uniref:S-adenosyl-L-methionine-dependent methyltransferase n=1 Tax=Hypoxylon trugodes TaxID=326681 RepID=UPI002193D59D|nr:S-adenosyl-L-methionine-dependent methyltransferase [Hypoxylon trugodes]KAI1384735.1 S-adenosyl-L-methionine-dependent methyltransferase [Hypoxylon trugodes]